MVKFSPVDANFSFWNAGVVRGSEISGALKQKTLHIPQKLLEISWTDEIDVCKRYTRNFEL